MNKTTQREIAISAARSYLREQGIDPLTCDSLDALEALDDLERLDGETIAAQWYRDATPNQIKLFEREWRKWRRGWTATNRMVRKAYKRISRNGLPGVLKSLDELDAALRKQGAD